LTKGFSMSEDAQELLVKNAQTPETSPAIATLEDSPPADIISYDALSAGQPPSEAPALDIPVFEASPEEVPPVEAPSLEAPPAPSAGALLRQAREASGLHIAALAVALKVPVKRLEALEADRFDLLPSAVFSRGLASSVCRALKIDPAAVLAQLPGLAAPRLGYSDQNRLHAYSAPSSNHRPSLWGSLSRPALIAGALLLVAAALVVFLPPSPLNFLKSGVGDAAVVTTTVVPLDAAATPPAGAPTLEAPVTALTPAAPVAPVPAPVPPVFPLAVSVAAPAAKPAPAAQPAAPLAETAKGPTTGLVVFNPTAASWVEVTDAQGTVLLRRMLAAGEVAGASGALPLSAVVGRADVTRVQVRGQPLDLAPIARDNVARFEVK
jgi:cytoskeleton protein RodZ